MSAPVRIVRAAILVAALLLMTTVGAPQRSDAASATAPTAVASGVCDLAGPLSRTACDVGKGVGKGVTGPVRGAKKAVEKAGDLTSKAGDTLKSFTPQGAVETWAQSTAQGSTEMLAKLQESLLDNTKPEFKGADWWAKRYSVTYGLGFVVMAFSLTAAVGRLGRGGPEAAQLAKETMSRAVLFAPVVVAMPALVMIVADGLNALAHWFGVQASKDAGSTIGAYVDSLSSMKDTNTGIVGGTLSLLLLAGITFIAAVLAMVELTISEFGVYFLTLLFPLLWGLAVNPRWRSKAHKWMGALIGTLVVPVALFFGFWVLWGMAGSVQQGKTAGDRFGLMALVAVGTVMCVLAPVVVGWVLGSLVSDSSHDHVQGARALRGAGLQAGRGVTRSTTRMASMMGGRGGGRAAALGGGRTAGTRPSTPMRSTGTRSGGSAPKGEGRMRTAQRASGGATAGPSAAPKGAGAGQGGSSGSTSSGSAPGNAGSSAGGGSHRAGGGNPGPVAKPRRQPNTSSGGGL